MRFRSLVIWVAVLGFLIWAAYTIVYASSAYFEMAGVIDHVASEAISRRKAAVAAGMPEAGRDFVPGLRVAVATAAKRNGIQLEEGAVEVVETPGAVQLSVKWSFPALTYGDTTYVHLPLSVSRTLRPAP